MVQAVDETEDQASPHTSSPVSGRRDFAPGGTGRVVFSVAAAALIVSVLAPFGEDALLGTLNIRTPMARRVAAATQEVGRLEQRTAELEQRLAAVTAQLAQEQAQSADAAGRVDKGQDWIRTLALVQLGAALRRPGPFDLELAMARTSEAMPPELEPLLAKIEPYGGTGVPGIAQLQREFASLRARIDWDEHGLMMPMAWMNRLITWPHATGHPQADGADRYSSEAAAELSKDNLPGAIAYARQISGLSGELLTDWMEDAEARVALDELARRVNELVARRLGGTSSPPARRLD